MTAQPVGGTSYVSRPGAPESDLGDTLRSLIFVADNQKEAGGKCSWSKTSLHLGGGV